MELVQVACYGKFGFCRPDLDGNKLAKGMRLVVQLKFYEPRNFKYYEVFFADFCFCSTFSAWLSKLQLRATPGNHKNSKWPP